MESNEKFIVKEISLSEKNDQIKNDGQVSAATKKNLPKAFKPNVPDTKWIQVYVNGDEHFSGLKCVVNSKHYRSFDVFLNYLTERLQPSFGAIRNIYTPINGNSINQLEELLPNCIYVVAGHERLKKLEPGYSAIGGKNVWRSEFKPFSKKKNDICRVKSSCFSSFTFCFYKNGSSAMPCKITFHNKDLENWNGIFQKINEKMQCGLIKRLYSTNGKPIKSITELNNGQSYVIVGRYEVFKRAAYKTNNSRSKSNGQQSGKLSCPELKKTSAQSRIISRAASMSLVGQSNGRNSGPLRNPSNSYHGENVDNDSIKREDSNKLNSSTESVNQLRNGDASKFESFLKIKQIDLDVDWGGIYRAKMQSCIAEGASEIQDDIETAVDIPFDHSDPEEIEEELTPDMERSLQHLNLVDAPEELVAYLPSMQGKQPMVNNGRISSDKHNLPQSEAKESQNLLM